MREMRGHNALPFRWGWDRLLAPARVGAGARPSRAGSGGGAEGGAADWPAVRPNVGLDPPSGAPRMRRAGASEI